MSKSAKTKSVEPAAKKIDKKSEKKATPASTKPAKKKPSGKVGGLGTQRRRAGTGFHPAARRRRRSVLKDFAGQKLVMFFYPRADTPGCTLEAVDFTRLAAEFAACDTAVIGVSADPVKAQDNSATSIASAIPLLSDETHKMLGAYGVWGEKSMYGKVFEGVLRTTVLIDTKGRIAQVWSGVKVDGHADAVLAAAREL